MKRWLILMLLLNCATMYSQDVGKAKPAGMEINFNMGINKNISSQMWRIGFKGLYEGNLSFAGRLFDRFYIGVGYQNSYFKNSDLFVQYTVPKPKPTGGAVITYNTHLMAHAGYIRFAYQKYFSEIGHVKYALNAGYAYCQYLGVNEDSLAANLPLIPKYFTTPYLQPEVSLNFVAEDNLSFALFLSYSTMFTHFNPKAPQFNQFEELRSANNRYVMSWINFGFGVTIMLNRKQSL